MTATGSSLQSGFTKRVRWLVGKFDKSMEFGEEFLLFFFFGVPKIGQPSVCDKLAVISSSVWADFCGLSWVR